MPSFSRSDSKQNLENASFLRARTWDGLAHVSGRSSDAQIAIEVYTEFVDLYPDSRLSDDALFSAAVIAEDLLEDNNRAYQLFQRILLEYDNGDMAGDARNHFVSLKKTGLDGLLQFFRCCKPYAPGQCADPGEYPLLERP